MKGNRGQITLFVIIGLILVIGAVVVISVISSQANPEDQLKKSVQEVDDIFRPVQQYVETCLYQTSLQGLRNIGEHGGYIDPLGANSRRSFSYTQTEPLASEGISLGSDEAFIPYWFHSTAPYESLNLQPSLAIPNIEDIQRDHEIYVNQHLFDCFNFEGLEQKGYDITVQDEEPVTEIFYADDGVVVKTSFEISVVGENGASESITSYLTTVPVPFKEYYDLAESITLYEANDQYLEGLILSLIGRYGRADYNALPSFSTTASTFEKVVWSKQLVGEKVKELLNTYVPLLTVYGSQSFIDYNLTGLSEQDQLFYQRFILPPTIATQSTIDVTHTYFNWPVYVNVDPSEGDLISPRFEDPGTGYGMFSQTEPEQHYDFFYDVSYPVLVSIRQEVNDLSPEEFTFMFALESNVRSNIDWTDYAQGNGPLAWDPDWIEPRLADHLAPTEIEEPLPVGTTDHQSTKKLFFNAEQRLSGNITLKVTDARTGEPIEGANVKLGVGTYATTNLGVTKLSETGLDAVFKGTAPLVRNGYLQVQAENYIDAYVPITTTYGTSQNLGYVSLWNISQKEIGVEVYDLATKSYRERNENELIVVSGTKLDDTVPQGHSFIAIFEGDTEKVNISLVAGRYTLNVILVDNNGITIPARCEQVVKFPQSLLVSEEERYIPQEDIIIDQMMWGGADFTEEFPWSISADKVYENNTLTFRALKFPVPECLDDLEQVAELETYTLQERTNILPVVN